MIDKERMENWGESSRGEEEERSRMGAKGLQPANNRLICDLRIGFAGNSFTLYGALVCKCGRRNMCNISKAGHLPGLIRVGVAAPVVAFEPSGHDLAPPTRYLLRILDRFSSYAKQAKTFPSCRWLFTRENFSIVYPISFDWQIRKWEFNHRFISWSRRLYFIRLTLLIQRWNDEYESFGNYCLLEKFLELQTLVETNILTNVF